MTDPIDYSRPVGWWCPVCDQTMGEDKFVSCLSPGWPCNGAAIPVYLPLPTPEPVEVDEVETGEAEVVTFECVGSVWLRGRHDITVADPTDAGVINYIVLGTTK
jgi:hypothetical protein